MGARVCVCVLKEELHRQDLVIDQTVGEVAGRIAVGLPFGRNLKF